MADKPKSRIRRRKQAPVREGASSNTYRRPTKRPASMPKVRRRNDSPKIMANAMPRPGDLRAAAIALSRGSIPEGSLLGNIVKSFGEAAKAPMPRTLGMVGTADNLIGNTVAQVKNLATQQRVRRQKARTQAASDNYKYGARQTGKVTARRRGTPVKGGQPTNRPKTAKKRVI